MENYMHQLIDKIDRMESEVHSISSAVSEIQKETLPNISKTIEVNKHNTKQELEDHFQNNKINDAMKNTIQLNDMILAEKRSNILNETCQRIKSRFSLTWKDCLNKRKQAYWHYIQNLSKSHLYEGWCKSSPEYIPLKFRPKKMLNEISTVTEARISEAKLVYSNDISIMQSYATKHENSYKEIDESINLMIDQKTVKCEERKLLKEWWIQDTLKNEEISKQLWRKRETFLTKKKLEEESSGDSMITNKTWAEMISSRQPNTNYKRNHKNTRKNDSNKIPRGPISTNKTYDDRRTTNVSIQPQDMRARTGEITSSINLSLPPPLHQPPKTSDHIQPQTSHSLPQLVQPQHTLVPDIARSQFSTYQGSQPLGPTAFQQSQDLFECEFNDGINATNNPYTSNYGGYHNLDTDSHIVPVPPNNLQHIPTNPSAIFNKTFPRQNADSTSIYPTYEHNLSAGPTRPLARQSQVPHNNTFLYNPIQRPVTS